MWLQMSSLADAGKVARLQARYQLLRQLIIELRAAMVERDPIGASVAPSADVYLQALDSETQHKSLVEMCEFVDAQLLNALSNLNDSHPIQQRIKAEYRKRVETIIPQIVAQIQTGVTFDKLMAFMAQERLVLAEEIADMPSQQFGQLRGGAGPRMARTIYSKGGRYTSYRQAMLSLISEPQHGFFITPSFDHTIGREGVTELRGRTIWSVIDQKKVPMSTLLVCDAWPSNPRMVWLFRDYEAQPMEYPIATLIHTDTEYLPIVWDHCSSLFQAIRQSQSVEEERIATLQWHMAHAMFYCRGSAAIAEWLCRSLFLAKGYRVTWSAQPDLEALCRPQVEDYVRDYNRFAELTML